MMDLENSLLIRCLECRLIRPPPKFQLTPPPAFPADLLTPEFLHSLTQPDNRHIARQLRNIKLKRCLTNSASNHHHQQQRLNDLVDSNQHASAASVVIQPQQPLLLTHEQSLVVFFVSFVLFLIVLSVAVFFTLKLLKIRRQLSQMNTFKTLNKSSTTSGSGTSSGSSSLSKSNTITSSELILTTPTSSSHHQQNQAFYNQLFETTKQFSSSSSSSTSSSSSPKNHHSTSYQQNYQHYLQAVPTNSTLFEYTTRLAPTTAEYDEITSQAYTMSSSVSNTANTAATAPTILQPIWYPHVFQYNNNNSQLNQQLPMMFYHLKPNSATIQNKDIIVC